MIGDGNCVFQAIAYCVGLFGHYSRYLSTVFKMVQFHKMQIYIYIYIYTTELYWPNKILNFVDGNVDTYTSDTGTTTDTFRYR
jgi:hypothetical protein